MTPAHTLGLLLALASVAACGSPSTEHAAATTPAIAAAPPTTAARPTTTETLPTTAAAATVAPAVTKTADATSVLTSVEWPAIIEILGRRRQALYATPVADEAAYLTICAAAEGGSCLNGLRTQIPSLVEQGLHITGADPYTVLGDDIVVEDVEQGQTIDTAHIVTVLVTVQRSTHPGQIVDANGDVQADITTDTPQGQNTRTRTTLVREAPGTEWRILDQTNAGTVPA